MLIKELLNLVEAEATFVVATLMIDYVDHNYRDKSTNVKIRFDAGTNDAAEQLADNMYDAGMKTEGYLELDVENEYVRDLVQHVVKDYKDMHGPATIDIGTIKVVKSASDKFFSFEPKDLGISFNQDLH